MTSLTTAPIDVLFLESHPHVGDQAAADLEAAGHRVHRCYASAGDAHCVALADDGGCPIDDGIDVAVLVRGPLEAVPTHLEDGVLCARRADIPIVEQGPEHPDPWSPWIDVRLDPESTELALVASAAARWVVAPARDAICRTLTPLLRAAGIDPTEMVCRIERAGTGLAVHVTLPTPVDTYVRNAIGVRALDALRANATKTLGNVSVFVHPGGRTSDG